MPDSTMPILLDTDIGSDIDDAVCLAYLLQQPHCELVGITTVSGEARKRAMLVDALCRAAGREDIPIHSGSETPLLLQQQQRRAAQAAVLPRFPHRTDFASHTAVEFLRQTIRSRPGEILLLAIGPLTNIALLFALDPEIPRLLRGLVMMAGIFHPRSYCRSMREWNVVCDPHAAAMVYRAPATPHISIGLDVTGLCRLPADECRRRFTGGPLELVAQMAEVWFTQREQITFHDPLAAAVIFHPELCTYEAGQAEIELLSPQAAGMIHWNTRGEHLPHQAAVGVDAQAFFAEYFRVVGGQA